MRVVAKCRRRDVKKPSTNEVSGTLPGVNFALPAQAGVEYMRVVGVMSGSSLDGIDLALCDFREENGRILHDVLACESIAFPGSLYTRLLHISTSSALTLAETHVQLGRFIGGSVGTFLDARGPAELVASHGHTAFHQPDKGFTTQIGSGSDIAALTGLPTVVDLRSKDVALGGQGAPLVPIGERDLFSGFDAYVNLGGIANISIHRAGRVTGADVCFCNQPLNHLAELLGKAYDADGAIARWGKVDNGLLFRFGAMPVLSGSTRFTLGREHFERDMLPLLGENGTGVEDRLSTTVEHIALQLAAHLNKEAVTRCLVTGGGAFNGFLMERMRARISAELVVPDDRTVAFKEAVIFAYLGWLRWHGLPNALASVTGSLRDSVGGALYLPN